MGIPVGKVGITTAKLTKSGNGGKKTMKMWAVILEAMKERYSNDPDLDKLKTKDNVYSGIESGKELYKSFMDEIASYQSVLKANGKRAMRSDAVLGFAVIVKPSADVINSWDKATKNKFWADTDKIIYEFMGRNEKTGKDNIRADVLQVDEQADHKHYFGIPYTKDGRICAKEVINLKLFNKFNKEYPRLMSAQGWDVDDCTVYDVDKVKTMTDNEQADYKANNIANKKAKGYGRSSLRYKADQEKEKAEAAKKALEAEVDKNKQLEKENAKLAEQIKQLTANVDTSKKLESTEQSEPTISVYDPQKAADMAAEGKFLSQSDFGANLDEIIALTGDKPSNVDTPETPVIPEQKQVANNNLDTSEYDFNDDDDNFGLGADFTPETQVIPEQADSQQTNIDTVKPQVIPEQADSQQPDEGTVKPQVIPEQTESKQPDEDTIKTPVILNIPKQKQVVVNNFDTSEYDFNDDDDNFGLGADFTPETQVIPEQKKVVEMPPIDNKKPTLEAEAERDALSAKSAAIPEKQLQEALKPDKQTKTFDVVENVENATKTYSEMSETSTENKVIPVASGSKTPEPSPIPETESFNMYKTIEDDGNLDSKTEEVKSETQAASIVAESKPLETPSVSEPKYFIPTFSTDSQKPADKVTGNEVGEVDVTKGVFEKIEAAMAEKALSGERYNSDLDTLNLDSKDNTQKEPDNPLF